MAPSYPSPILRDMDSPRAGPQKGVTIVDEPEHISEPSFKVGTDDKNQDTNSPTFVVSQSPRLHRASISGKKLTGRPPPNSTNSSNNISSSGAALTKAMSYFSLDGGHGAEPSLQAAGESTTPGTTPAESKTPDLRGILSQVAEWLQEEKSRQRKRGHHLPRLHRDQHLQTPELQPGESRTHESTLDDDSAYSLDKLESILQGFSGDASKLLRKGSTVSLRKGSIASRFKLSRSAPSSDTEHHGDDILVPNVEAKLDNTKTMAYADAAPDMAGNDKAKRRDHDHWVKFKQDILTLTHTLKLKGWRRILMEQAAEIDVSRLSGALTNAVYVVHPPKNLPEQSANPADSTLSVSRRRPNPLLLRVYGPQVEHLIDRDTELNILRRLARKRIGPLMLGTFENGRFEEFLHATTLTAEDLRVPETSKQIAKRMRELHDGIELLESELNVGPATFENWDKWVDRCEKVTTWLDAQVHQAERELTAGTSRRNSVVKLRNVRRGYICGVEWPVFRRVYDRYRKRLVEDSGGRSGIRKQLLFSHNDTQYGNLMRLQPSGTSPLLQPSNQHKQLVVIDFEYAAQNLAGLEFANHFTEWCYNYHTPPDKSYICDTRRYPSEEEQYRFVRSYVMHRPQFNAAASSTPKMEAREKTNINDFMLDARTPGGSTGGPSNDYIGGGGATFNYDKEEKEREKAQEEEIQRLLKEARVWRVANSAKWVAWGIVQAKIPELDALEEKEKEQMAKKISHTMSERKKSLTGKVATGQQKVLEKVNHMVDKHGFKGGLRPLPMSDPLTEEEKKIRRESQWDRPEGRAQEMEHHEGDVEAPSEPQPDDAQTTRTPADQSTATTEPPAEPRTQKQQAPKENANPVSEHQEEEEEEEEEEEFDYLGYAQDRAMFFWGDCIQMGLVKEEELPKQLRERVKVVPN